MRHLYKHIIPRLDKSVIYSMCAFHMFWASQAACANQVQLSDAKLADIGGIISLTARPILQANPDLTALSFGLLTASYPQLREHQSAAAIKTSSGPAYINEAARSLMRIPFASLPSKSISDTDQLTFDLTEMPGSQTTNSQVKHQPCQPGRSCNVPDQLASITASLNPQNPSSTPKPMYGPAETKPNEDLSAEAAELKHVKRMQNTNKILEITYQVLNVVDLAQTIHCLNQTGCSEANPILGKSPSMVKLLAYKLGLGALHFISYKRTEHNWKRTRIMEMISISIQGGTVAWNAKLLF